MTPKTVAEIQDDEYEEEIIDSVEKETGGYAVGHHGWTLWVETETIEPKVGDVIRMYGCGIGYQIRGIAINGQVVRYQSAAEMEAEHTDRIRRENEEKREKALADHAENEAKIAALPTPFQDRLKRFQRVSETFEWQYQPYELFVCEQAVVIAEAFVSDHEALKDWAKADWAEQKRRVPGLGDGHSGNTFGAACRLAWNYLEQPDLIVKEHGALCPLVGCRDYGCWAAEQAAA